VSLLAKVNTGVVPHPPKICITGQPGIGKSTLASGFDNALFVEVASRTLHLDVNRVQVDTWEEVLALINEVADSTYKTLVLDPINDIEELCLDFITRKADAPNYMEIGGGYAKYRAPLRKQWRRLLSLFDRLQSKGVQIVLTGHTVVKTFNPPDGEAFDRYILKLDDATATLITENVDLIGYAHYKTLVKVKKEGMKTSGKAKTTGERIIEFKHNPAYPSKKGIPCADKCNLDFDSFMKALNNGS